MRRCWLLQTYITKLITGAQHCRAAWVLFSLFSYRHMFHLWKYGYFHAEFREFIFSFYTQKEHTHFKRWTIAIPAHDIGVRQGFMHLSPVLFTFLKNMREILHDHHPFIISIGGRPICDLYSSHTTSIYIGTNSCLDFTDTNRLIVQTHMEWRPAVTRVKSWPDGH